MKTARETEYIAYFLLIVGLIFIYNSSIVHSQNIFGDPHRFFFLHMGWVVIGILFFKLFSKISFTSLVAFAPALYVITLGFLLFLAFWGLLPCSMSTTFAPCINNANRWFVFNPQPLPQIPYIGELTFQPSELAKLAIILFLAYKFKKHNESSGSRKTLYKSFSAYLLYTSLYSLLIILEPNMSTAVLVFAIGSAMYFASGEDIKPYLLLLPLIFLIGLLFIFGSTYRRQRLLAYLGPSQAEESYQVRQVKIALGSGGLFGVGFGQSRQKYTYLPEVATDSIFAVIGEEFGFIGTLVISGVFLRLVLNGVAIAKSLNNMQGKLISVGIVTWIGLQFLIHIMANSGLIPYTGVPLPLISYGGSSLLFNMIALGVLVNIANQTRA